jgi:hypothetical protein
MKAYILDNDVCKLFKCVFVWWIYKKNFTLVKIWTFGSRSGIESGSAFLSKSLNSDPHSSKSLDPDPNILRGCSRCKLGSSAVYIQGGAGIFGPEGSEICISCKTTNFCYFHIKLRHVSTNGINFHFMR